MEICRRILLTPESAHLNARSAQIAPTRFSPEHARTAAATWLPALSGRLPHFTNIRHRRAASTIRKAARVFGKWLVVLLCERPTINNEAGFLRNLVVQLHCCRIGLMGLPIHAS